MKPRSLSVVVPIFNEEPVIPELYRRLTGALTELGLPYEMVFVDDGSADRSGELLEQLAMSDPNVRLLQLSRNFGLYVAVTAGLNEATGTLVALIDGDLQDPPEALPQLLAKIDEGYDVVYVIRIKRKESLVKRGVVHLFYRVLNRIASTPLPVDSGLFCVMTRQVVDALKQLPERVRYVSGLRAWVGFRQCGVPLERASRRAGAPRQTLGKLSRMALDGMLSFSYVPLRLATFAGLATALVAIAGMIWAVALHFFSDHPPQGWASTVFFVLLIGGVQLLALGVIGEYIGRVYDEVKQRPLYVVRRRVGFSGAASEEGIRDDEPRSDAYRSRRSPVGTA